MSLVDQIKSWRARWKSEGPPQDVINKAFATMFGSYDGKICKDYLLGTYLLPLDGGLEGPTGIKLSEHNGQLLLLMDMMRREDVGNHPKMFGEIEDEEKIDHDPRLPT